MDFFTATPLWVYPGTEVYEIAKQKGIQLEESTITKMIKQLTDNWGTTFGGEKVFDFYGENVFQKLLYASSPFDFYKKFILHEYDVLVKKYIPPEQKMVRRPRAMLNNEWFDVHFVDKDFTSGQPLFDVIEIPTKDTVIRKTNARRGKFPFIKKILPTNTTAVKEMWTEIPLGKVRYQSLFEFGKSKVRIKLKPNKTGIKYTLSDTTTKRRKSIHKRILAEKVKKGSSLRDAAVAFKRRLVVLRTYRKKNKNSKAYKTLNSDINFITKKYL
jgi:hypothetical protein